MRGKHRSWPCFIPLFFFFRHLSFSACSHSQVVLLIFTEPLPTTRSWWLGQKALQSFLDLFIYFFVKPEMFFRPPPCLTNSLCVCGFFFSAFFSTNYSIPFPGLQQSWKCWSVIAALLNLSLFDYTSFLLICFLISCSSSLISSVNVSSSKSFELFNTKCVSWVITRLQKVLMDTRPFFSAQSLHLHYSAGFCDFLSTMYSLCKISSLLKGLIKLSDKSIW